MYTRLSNRNANWKTRAQELKRKLETVRFLQMSINIAPAMIKSTYLDEEAAVKQ